MVQVMSNHSYTFSAWKCEKIDELLLVLFGALIHHIANPFKDIFEDLCTYFKYFLSFQILSPFLWVTLLGKPIKQYQTPSPFFSQVDRT